MHSAKAVIKTYLSLTLFSTFASSFIWGINTLFLLDAGLSIGQAFSANAFFTLGQVIFEVPTGVVADTSGRRLSYLLGTITLFFSTFGYWYLWASQGPFWAWAVMSALLGLGFTFFSGATEAWLVDALDHYKHVQPLDEVLAKGQITAGIAMLSGTVAGGFIAQFTSLGVPYILRMLMLVITFGVAYKLMFDKGFEPRKRISVKKEINHIARQSLKHGLGNAPVRGLMLASIFTAGVGIYAFYAMQPYLLELYGNSESYAIAGLAAAIVALTQVAGGASVKQVRKLFKTRTTAIIIGILISSTSLVLVGLTTSFAVALGLLVVWGAIFSATIPIRQAFLNKLIPSNQRATVLSFDSLLGSLGGVIAQPGLGKTAGLFGYAVSYVVSGIVTLLAIPFVLLSKKEKSEADIIVTNGTV